jgi:hypothetical protein
MAVRFHSSGRSSVDIRGRLYLQRSNINLVYAPGFWGSGIGVLKGISESMKTVSGDLPSLTHDDLLPDGNKA